MDGPTTNLEPHGEPKPKKPAPPLPTPHTPDELSAAIRSPLRAIDLILADRKRLVATSATALASRLVVLLLLVSLVFTLPYGLIVGKPWQIAVLFVGAIGVCWPSLFVFAAYAGVKLPPMTSLIVALTMTAVASVFTFGFAPILWFIASTMPDSTQITVTGLSFFMLALALCAGLLQLLRNSVTAESLRWPSVHPALLLAWQGLVVFIWIRMANWLELT